MSLSPKYSKPQATWKLQNEMSVLKRSMEENEKLHKQQLKATEAKMDRMERALKEHTAAKEAVKEDPTAASSGIASAPGNNVEKSMEAWRWNSQFQALVRQVQQLEKQLGTTGTNSQKIQTSKSELVHGTVEKRGGEGIKIDALNKQLEQLSTQLQQQSKELRDVKEELRVSKQAHIGNSGELRAVTEAVVYGKNDGNSAPDELETLKEELQTLREEVQHNKDISEQLSTVKNEFRSFQNESSDALKSFKEELLAVKDVLSATQDELRVAKEKLEYSKKESAAENENIRSKLQEMCTLQEESTNKVRAELQGMIKSFWSDSEKLEQHLSKQFQEQEKQLLRIKDESTHEEAMQEMVEMWDKQFEELIQFVQDQGEDQKAANADLQESLQATKEHHDVLQLKLDAISKTWDSKLEQFKRWVQKPVADERIAHQELRENVKADIEKQLQTWNDQVGSLANFIKEEVVSLKAIRYDQNASKLEMKQKVEHFKIEFEELLKQARHNNDLAQTMNEKIRMEREEQEKKDSERSQKLDAWESQFNDLERKVQLQTKALKSANEAIRIAFRDRDDATKEAASAKEMYQRAKTELDDLKALLSEKDSLKEIRRKRKQIKSNLDKRKDLLRELLSDEDDINLAGIEVEARDAV